MKVRRWDVGGGLPRALFSLKAGARIVSLLMGFNHTEKRERNTTGRCFSLVSFRWLLLVSFVPQLGT